jgi:hypothetical protein
VPRSLGVGWWPRGALQKYLRVIRRTQTPLTGSEGSMPPSGGIPLQIVPAGLGNVLGYLGSVAEPWLCIERTQSHPSLCVLWGDCRTLPRG